MKNEIMHKKTLIYSYAAILMSSDSNKVAMQ